MTAAEKKKALTFIERSLSPDVSPVASNRKQNVLFVEPTVAAQNWNSKSVQFAAVVGGIRPPHWTAAARPAWQRGGELIFIVLSVWVSCFVVARSVTEVWAALLAGELNLERFHSCSLSCAAQHGPALISHQVAIISPSCAQDKCSSSKHASLLCATLRGPTDCRAHYLFMCALHGPYCWISPYTQLITVWIALGFKLMSHPRKSASSS